VPLRYATLADLQVEVRKEICGDSADVPLPPPKFLDGPKSNQIWSVLCDTIKDDGQLLCFVSTRKSAQSVAKDLAKRMKSRAKKDENKKSLKILHTTYLTHILVVFNLGRSVLKWFTLCKYLIQVYFDISVYKLV
jgi:Lhr-like helicase